MKNSYGFKMFLVVSSFILLFGSIAAFVFVNFYLRPATSPDSPTIKPTATITTPTSSNTLDFTTTPTNTAELNNKVTYELPPLKSTKYVFTYPNKPEFTILKNDQTSIIFDYKSSKLNIGPVTLTGKNSWEVKTFTGTAVGNYDSNLKLVKEKSDTQYDYYYIGSPMKKDEWNCKDGDTNGFCYYKTYPSYWQQSYNYSIQAEMQIKLGEVDQVLPIFKNIIDTSKNFFVDTLIYRGDFEHAENNRFAYFDLVDPKDYIYFSLDLFYDDDGNRVATGTATTHGLTNFFLVKREAASTLMDLKSPNSIGKSFKVSGLASNIAPSEESIYKFAEIESITEVK